MSSVKAVTIGLPVLVALWGCGTSAATPGQVTGAERQTLIHQGIERTYIVRGPGGSTVAAPPALVIVLHGGGGNALNAEAMTGFTQKALEEGFIVVYPDGTGRRRDALLTWNAGHCCGYAMQNRIDDVGFINALIDRHALGVDRNRIYVTGMSNGAMMAHRVGIELSNRIAAIAPVVGAVFGDEPHPIQPVSAIMINGLLDESVPHQGGRTGGRFPGSWDGTPTRPALDQGTFWSRANDCSLTPRRDDRGAYTVYTHDCPEGRGVEVHVVEDQGHAWPGGRKGSSLADPPSAAFNATDVIWRFFAAHPKR
jgi:polyhydroxybutyrate depolymerase